MKKITNEEALELINKYNEAKDKLELQKREVELLKAQLVKFLNGKESKQVDIYLVSNKTFIQNRFDTNKFKIKNQELYSKYIQKVQQVKFNVKVH